MTEKPHLAKVTQSDKIRSVDKKIRMCNEMVKLVAIINIVGINRFK